MVPASGPSGATLYVPWPSPSTPMPAVAFSRGAGFVRPCLVTSNQGKYKAMTKRAISWPLLVIKLIEKGGYVRSLGMADKYMWQRGGGLLDWQWPCGRLLMCVCVCVQWCTSCVCVCVWVCVRDNPGESLSLKGNRCRFTYVEGPQPVMRLAGWDLSSQQLEGAYLINAWS